MAVPQTAERWTFTRRPSRTSKRRAVAAAGEPRAHAQRQGHVGAARVAAGQAQGDGHVEPRQRLEDHVLQREVRAQPAARSPACRRTRCPRTPSSAPDWRSCEQHAVDAVGPLVHVLQERIVSSWAPERPGRAGGGGQQGEAAAAQAAHGLALAQRLELAVFAGVGRALAGQAPTAGSRGGRRRWPARAPPWARAGHDPEPGQVEVEQRDVAVAHEGLGVRAQQRGVEAWQQPGRCPRRRARR